MKITDLKTIAERRKFIEDKLNLKFDSISVYPPGIEKAQERNCENMIGAVSVPLGIAGPIAIQGEFARGEHYLPLATTEGALIASINRGCKAITLSGGATVLSNNLGMTRGSVFKTAGIVAGRLLKNYIEDNSELWDKIAATTSSHLRLKGIFTKIVGKNVYVRFSYDTMDAMGMNMVTIAQDKIVREIEKNMNVRCLSLAGNFDMDKKPAWLNFILGRGREVWAEATITEDIIKNVLKTTSQAIHEVSIGKNMLGSIVSGSIGYNAHFANVIAAIFMAAGQDVAHAVEGSLGITTTEIGSKGDLYISVYLPDLPVGAIGGGTYLDAQSECLKILTLDRVASGKKASTFAEIIGGGVLAGEISLLAALAQGTLSESHQKLARGKKSDSG